MYIPRGKILSALLATHSSVRIDLDEKAIPRACGATIQAALNDGEDFELLFTVSPDRMPITVARLLAVLAVSRATCRRKFLSSANVTFVQLNRMFGA